MPQSGNGRVARADSQSTRNNGVNETVRGPFQSLLLQARVRVWVPEPGRVLSMPWPPPGRYAVIDDEVETDLGQREVKFVGCAVDRAKVACQVGAQIEDWNDLCVGDPTLLLPAARYRLESNTVQSRDGDSLAPEQRWLRGVFGRQ
jgi:hypothetical protein